ncbi:MAG: transcriptional regulator MntR [Methanocellales archaeon]|nr:transcriptional regulator MntR [Methanocellales archaeon]
MISQSVEDCLETIYELTKEKGYARTTEISSSLGVQPPSVTEMIQKLGENEFLFYEKYKGVTLTPKGEELAKSIKQRHMTLAKLLKILGIDDETAEKDACRIEHNVHPTTMKRLAKFVEFVHEMAHHPTWLKHFEHYVKTGEHLECKCPICGYPMRVRLDNLSWKR